MRLSALSAALLSVTALATAAPASDFRALNGLHVSAIGPRDFIVDYGGLQGSTDFWCAAGDYAVFGLGLPWNTRIYRTSPEPRRAGQGITFSLDSAHAVNSGVTRFGAKDAGFSATSARDLCELFIDLRGFGGLTGP